MLKRIGLIFLALVIAASIGLWFASRPAPPLAASPEIRLTTGPVSGGWTDETQTIAVYNSLPFAAPPTGVLRWAPPAEPAAWNDVRDAREFGAECLQHRAGTAEWVQDVVKRHGLGGLKAWVAGVYIDNLPAANESEDCLYLNVRSGNIGSTELAPVMVWIHGGSHMTGSSSDFLYQSDGLVKKGVVLVTVNYRLGPFGYLAHPELSKDSETNTSGNYGLLDQIKSLEWVQDNIEAFGGDPNNITIFGESAGAQAVTEVMASPLSEGLYHKAIMQSGSSTYNRIHLKEPIETTPSAESVGQKFLAPLLPDDAVTMGAAELRNLPAADIVAHIPNAPHADGLFLPNVDGWVLPRMIGDTIRDGSAVGVPVLAGYNADEGTLFFNEITGKPTVLHPGEFPLTYDERIEALTDIYGEERTRALTNLYDLTSQKKWNAGAVDFLGDDVFGVHMRYLAKANARTGEPTWLYFFSRTPASETQTLGAFHASELAFVFDSHNTFLEPTEADYALTDKMGTYWTNFAKTGDPNEQGLANWPAYAEQSDQWLHLSHTIETLTGIRKDKLDILEATLNEKLGKSVQLSAIAHLSTEEAPVSAEQEPLANGFQP